MKIDYRVPATDWMLRIKNAITASGQAPTNLAHGLVIKHSQDKPEDIDTFPHNAGNLWIFHPATLVYYKTMVTKDHGDYITRLLKLLKAGGCENQVIKNLWAHDPFIIFVYTPPNYADIVVNNIKTRWQQAKTARNKINREIFVDACLQHDSGLCWPVVYQDGVQSTIDSVYKRANISLKSFVTKYNQKCASYERIPMGRKFDFFNKENSKLLSGNQMSRKEMYAHIKASHKFSLDVVRKSVEVISKMAACVTPPVGKKCLTAIGCVSLDKVVGIRNELVKSLTTKADMAFFRGTTIGGVVIMGRKTWESLPKEHRPLANRINVVISTTMRAEPGVFIYPSLEAAVHNCSHRWYGKQLFIIGGPTLWKQAFEEGFVYRTIITRPHVVVSPVTNQMDAADLVRFDFDKYLRNSYLHSRKELSRHPQDPDTVVEVFENYL